MLKHHMKNIFDMKDHRMLAIDILNVLNKYSSSDYKLFQKEIIYYLKKECGYKVNRRTLQTYLDLLKNDGYVDGYRGVYSKVKLIKK